MLIPTFGRHLLKFWVEIKKLEKPRWANWNSFCWLLQWTSMNGRQIFSIHIVLKCQRSSETQTFARLQHFCTFVIEIKDRMQYCMEESKRGCRARALGIGTRLLYALRAALRAARAGVMKSRFYNFKIVINLIHIINVSIHIANDKPKCFVFRFTYWRYLLYGMLCDREYKSVCRLLMRFSAGLFIVIFKVDVAR